MIENDSATHWHLKKIGELGTLIRGVNYKKEEATHIEREGYLPILRANNINGNLIFEDLVFVQKKNISQDQLIKKGDIIVSMSSGSRHLVGKSAKAISDFNGSFGAFCGLFRPNQTVNNDFIAYFFQSPFFKKHISEVSKGTNINNLKREHIIDSVCSLPPLTEQRAIVAKIEQLFSELDNGIANLKTAQAQLKIYRQAVLKYAFEGKLTRRYHGSGGLQDDADSTTRQSQIREIPPSVEISGSDNLPEGWRWVKLGELFSIKPQNGLYKPSNQYGFGTKILRIDGFYDGKILSDYHYQRVNLELSEIKKYSLSIGDIVINRVNSMSHLGKCGLVKNLEEETVFESNIMNVKINKDLASAEYITHYLTSIKGISELVKNAKQAVNQASINQQDISNAFIPLCSKTEQHQIIQQIESRLSVCDKLEADIQENLDKAEALRQSILKKAFEGRLLSVQELEACRREPDWEPAEKLLERIKKESIKLK